MRKVFIVCHYYNPLVIHSNNRFCYGTTNRSGAIVHYIFGRFSDKKTNVIEIIIQFAYYLICYVIYTLCTRIRNSIHFHSCTCIINRNTIIAIFVQCIFGYRIILYIYKIIRLHLGEIICRIKTVNDVIPQ